MKLLQHVDLVAHRKRLSPKTASAYSSWIKQYLRFSSARLGRWQHPTQLGTADCEAFLDDLVVRRRLSASSQNQALNALVFLYKHVLENAIPQDHLGKFAILRSRRPKRVPTVLSVDEVRRLVEAIDPTRMSRLMVELMYGTGMRVSEVCTLRVRDIDFGRAQVIVRAAKGDKDRIVMLPATVCDRLRAQVDTVEQQWRRDIARGGGYAPVPDALLHKRPRAGHELPWQFVFPSSVMRRDEAGRGVRWVAWPGVPCPTRQRGHGLSLGVRSGRTEDLPALTRGSRQPSGNPNSFASRESSCVTVWIAERRRDPTDLARALRAPPSAVEVPRRKRIAA